MKRYESFTELTRSFALREGTALEFLDEDGMLVKVSYPELSVRIMKRADEFFKKGSGTDTVYATHDLDSVVDLFASAVACRCILVSNPMMPDKVLEEANEGAVRLICDATVHAGDGELLFFTSGTTNRNKVVRLSSKTLCRSAWNGQQMLPCGPGDRILSILPLSHVYGFVCSLLWGLAYGATVCLCGDPERRLEAFRIFRPTILPAVPSIVEAMLRTDAFNPELKTILIGAAPCSEETASQLAARGLEVYIGYGLTETSSGIAITQGMDDLDAMHLCPDTEIRIEPDGEIAVSTPCMMKGYLGLPETTEGFWLYTGDLGWLDSEGRLHIQGRKNDVLVLGDGTKVCCPEYENDLAEMSGEHDIALVEKDGKIVLVAGAGADIESLREAVEEYNKTMIMSQQISDIEMFGRPLPRTITGKLRRYELDKLYYQ